jgi:HSP20 family protein
MDVKTISHRQPAIAKRQAPDFTEQLIEPFTQLRHEVDRLFEGFPFRMPSFMLGRFASAPVLEMTETKKHYKITAELPGIEPDNVEVTFDDGLLRIAGEKQEQREDDERDYRLSERSYGAFERLVELPSAADPEKIAARFKNGVLTISVAKNSEENRTVRRIKINPNG